MKRLMALAAMGLFSFTQTVVQAQGAADGGWLTLGGDHDHTRYSAADQITPDNFSDLEEEWVWDGASFNAASGRSTPSYIDGRLYTVAGPRRYVVALDPANGELIWSYGEPKTARYEYSMRKDYGPVRTCPPCSTANCESAAWEAPST